MGFLIETCDSGRAYEADRADTATTVNHKADRRYTLTVIALRLGRHSFEAGKMRKHLAAIVGISA